MQPLEKNPAPQGGNKLVIDCLRGWLKLAEQDPTWEYVLVIACQKSGFRQQFGHYFECEYTGAIGYDFAVNYAIDTIKMKILTGGLSRELPPSLSMGSQFADHVLYNLGKAALSFDFTAWLIDAEMTRIREGAPAPLKVCFFNPASDSIGAQSEHGQIMLNKVARPMLKLIGAVETTVPSGRSKEYYTYRHAVDAAKQGEKAPRFTASGQALAQAAGLEGAVTITLREAKYWTHRNSSEDWFSFATWLEYQGERVVFIRDTAKAHLPLDGFQTWPSASYDLELRMAAYQRAKCNFFVSNGPWNLGLFCEKPWAGFVTVDTSKEFDSNEPETHANAEWWKTYHGVDPATDEQFPWCRPDQRMIWEADTLERMKLVWLQFKEYWRQCEKRAAIS
jgi:hypothetical protein